MVQLFLFTVLSVSYYSFPRMTVNQLGLRNIEIPGLRMVWLKPETNRLYNIKIKLVKLKEAFTYEWRLTSHYEWVTISQHFTRGWWREDGRRGRTKQRWHWQGWAVQGMKIMWWIDHICQCHVGYDLSQIACKCTGQGSGFWAHILTVTLTERPVLWLFLAYLQKEEHCYYVRSYTDIDHMCSFNSFINTYSIV